MADRLPDASLDGIRDAMALIRAVEADDREAVEVVVQNLAHLSFTCGLLASLARPDALDHLGALLAREEAEYPGYRSDLLDDDHG